MQIMYTVEVGGINKPLHNVSVEDGKITKMSTWLTKKLCIGFSSLEDLDQAIDCLQSLKTEVVNKMLSTGSKIIPHTYQVEGKPIISVLAHMDDAPEAYDVHVCTIDTSNIPDVISLRRGGSFPHQMIDLFVQSGKSVDLGQKILTEAIRNKVRKEEGKQ